MKYLFIVLIAFVAILSGSEALTANKTRTSVIRRRSHHLTETKRIHGTARDASEGIWVCPMYTGNKVFVEYSTTLGASIVKKNGDQIPYSCKTSMNAPAFQQVTECGAQFAAKVKQFEPTWFDEIGWSTIFQDPCKKRD